jgi:hypothetical protein
MYHGTNKLHSLFVTMAAIEELGLIEQCTCQAVLTELDKAEMSRSNFASEVGLRWKRRPPSTQIFTKLMPAACLPAACLPS